MNPFQFKALYFSSSSFSSLAPARSRRAERVKCLLLCCINIMCLRTKNVYYPILRSPSRSEPAPALTGMEMGLDIMGNSENIGSNIIFSSTLLWHSKKATGREKSWQVEVGRMCWGRRRVKPRSPNINSITPNGERKKYCLLGNSVIHIIPFHTFSCLGAGDLQEVNCFQSWVTEVCEILALLWKIGGTVSMRYFEAKGPFWWCCCDGKGFPAPQTRRKFLSVSVKSLDADDN